MSKDKSAKPAIFTLHGYIKAQIAKAIGFHERTLPDMTWMSILQLLWLKIQIAISDLRTFLVGSKTDDHLCEKWEPEYRKWFDKLVKLTVDRDMASFEMDYHRTGKIKYSWTRDDLSEADIAKLPDWWFDGTKAKRQLRKINAKQD